MSGEKSTQQPLLEPDKVLATITALRRRIDERFAGSGLAGVCAKLERIGSSSRAQARWIARPNPALRALSIALTVVLVAGLVAAVLGVRPVGGRTSFVEFVQGVESGVNDVVFVAVALYFVWGIERRIKRSRALRALHELRSLAHVIDMHQLTKDPHVLLGRAQPTQSSPPRGLTPFELSRYLDYCSEMLSLTGKLSVLYLQHSDDAAVIESAAEVEALTTGLSRKIWQKLMILYASGRLDPAAEA